MFTVTTVNRQARVRTRKTFEDYETAVDYARRLAAGQRRPLFVNVWQGTKLVWTAISGRVLL